MAVTPDNSTLIVAESYGLLHLFHDRLWWLIGSQPRGSSGALVKGTARKGSCIREVRFVFASISGKSRFRRRSMMGSTLLRDSSTRLPSSRE
jgi:hypothetical protein